MSSERVAELIRAGQLFHQRGWVPGTSGNLSFRDGDGFAITRSGCHKGELTAPDIVLAELDGRPRDPGDRCSAETVLHSQLYQRLPYVCAVLHTHSMWATQASMMRDTIVLAGYELLKALRGVTTHDVAVEIPVFDNEQDMARLSRAVDAWLDRTPAPHAYLIAGHGLYTWGETIEIARYRVEALEFLFECEQRRRVVP